jgi:hypothetical protein
MVRMARMDWRELTAKMVVQVRMAKTEITFAPMEIRAMELQAMAI